LCSDDIPEYQGKDFEILSAIDEGAEGSVYLAKSNGIKYAIKEITINKDYFKTVKNLIEQVIPSFIHSSQFELINQINHPNVLKMKKMFKQERKVFNNLSKSCVLIQMEYCDGGNLENFINTSNDKLNFKLVFKFIDSLIESICALHEKGIIHRDIKTKNIFLFDKFNSNF
jgi:serine/threonine protein kinase